MNVRLNEPALHLLLNTQEGPVGRDIIRRAVNVRDLARAKVAFIMARSPVDISQDVDFSIDESLTATIGIRDSGRQARYLAEKETREYVWLVPALVAGFNE